MLLVLRPVPIEEMKYALMEEFFTKECFEKAWRRFPIYLILKLQQQSAKLKIQLIQLKNQLVKVCKVVLNQEKRLPKEKSTKKKKTTKRKKKTARRKTSKTASERQRLENH